MFELLLIVATVVAVATIADADGRSAIIWGAITLVACLLSAVIPLPLIRIVIAGVAVLVGMTIYKVVANA